MQTPAASQTAEQRILAERARTLAQTQARTAERTVGEELLVFQLGDARYALVAQAVREVLPLTGYTALPNTPPFVVGLVNVRGRLVTAIDLRPLLDLVVTPLQTQAALLLLHVDGIEVGLVADQVREIAASDAELTPAFSAVAGRSITWVRGIDRQRNLILDPAALLADPQLIVNEAIM